MRAAPNWYMQTGICWHKAGTHGYNYLISMNWKYFIALSYQTQAKVVDLGESDSCFELKVELFYFT